MTSQGINDTLQKEQSEREEMEAKRKARLEAERIAQLEAAKKRRPSQGRPSREVVFSCTAHDS